jgi:hypothetical protein
MSEDILINITPQETRVALALQGAVQELHIERTTSRGMAGNIYLGLHRYRPRARGLPACRRHLGSAQP